MNNDTSARCPQCGAPLKEKAPAGLCPNCLRALNLQTETVFTGDTIAAHSPLPLEKLAPHFPQLEIVEWSLAHVQRATQLRATEIFRVGASVIDRQTGRVESPRGEQRLRAKELNLLAHLYHHPTVTFTREELLQQVWNSQPGLLTRTVDQTVATLRRKIETKPKQPRFLQTVYRMGYRLVVEI